MKRFLKATLVSVFALLAVAVTAVPAAAACTSSPCADDLTANPQYLRPSVDLTVFGIDLTSALLVSSLQEARVDFAQVGDADFATTDLETSPDGIILWRDSSHLTTATQDKLDAGDVRVSSGFTFSGLRATLDVTPDYPLPAADAAEGTYTFLLTIRLSSLVSNDDDFTVTLPSDAFDTSTLPTSITAVTSHTIIGDPIPPTVSLFAAPTVQTGNFFWTISEPVTGVTSNSAVLRESGSTTNLPSTTSYDAVTRVVTLDPTTSLIVGQPYDAILLPDGPGPVVDRAGNELDTDTRTNLRVLNAAENAYGASYHWRKVTNSNAYGGSYTVNNLRGGAASWVFSGTRVTWYTITDRFQGKANVYIDGRTIATVNNYSSTTKYKVPRTYSGLSNTTHKITIRVAGIKGSSAGRDTRVSIDAFKLGGLFGTPNAAYYWSKFLSSSAADGAYLAARFPWTDMTFLFYGTGVDWRTIVGPNMGKAVVYVDGVTQGVVDNYSTFTFYNFIRQYHGLAAGLHTLRIQVYGTRNPNATDSIIAIDGFTAV